MREEMAESPLIALRLRAQRLDPATRLAYRDPAAIVRRLVGIQAQESESAALALGVRATTLTASQIEETRVVHRTFVRTWAFRGTLHLVPSVDLGGLLARLRSAILRASRRRHEQLGLTDQRYAAVLGVICSALSSEGPLTRAALADRLDANGYELERQALYHALRRAGLEGILCYGPNAADEPSYVLLHDWLPGFGADAAPYPLADLARRYLEGYGPAGPEDFASWSGLGLRDSRTAFRELGGELEPVNGAGEGVRILKTQIPWLDDIAAALGDVRFLPAYDPYLLGYRTRELIVSDEDASRIHPGGGFLRPTVIVDGLAVATWRLQHQEDRLTVIVEPFALLTRSARHALDEEVEALGLFFGVSATLRIA